MRLPTRPPDTEPPDQPGSPRIRQVAAARRRAGRTPRSWLLLCCLLPPPAGAAATADVAGELERLGAQYGFAIRGLEQTRDKPGRLEGEALIPRLRALLEEFDHVMVQTPDGGLERLIVLGTKAAPGSPVPGAAAVSGEREILLPTERVGASHAVTLTLEGASGQHLAQRLLIDTGADSVVLPASLIAALGIPETGLTASQVQTANGLADARIGLLPAIWLGDRRLESIPTAFIADENLGGNALLGMSVLGRFRILIDDAQHQLRLQGQ